ncbi:MAG: eukaryotic-like serine/threonine-protein kinase [Acidobacteriota bacterium]|jgi:serine/threonine protein kinase|nr:eukaryotic-like serine/threonine-protein kinase [Acidobacteriota bacterium]
MPAPDTVLQGRYRIVRQLGKGGMGAVYEAVDERLSRTVALKETLAESDELKRAFEREARLLANLRHPALPKVIDHFTEESGQFLVMEFIPGNDLGDLLERRQQPFSSDEVLRWADDLLDALDYLHTNEPPIIHRDIKPANLKLTAKGKIILLDFGLAKGAAGQMTRTASGMSVIGYTLNYAALEQIQGERTGPRSDLYSLAATLYQLLTGHTPIDALKRAADLLNDEADPLPPIRSLNPDVPESFAAVLMQALSLKPSSRPANAAEMRDALHDVPLVFAHVAPVEDDEMTKVSATPSAPGRLPLIAIGGEQTMVLDPSTREPLGPNGSGRLHHGAYPASEEESNAKKWWLIGGGAVLTVILIVGIFLLARHSGTTVTPATAPTAYDAVPDPFRASMPSVVEVTMQDASGKVIHQASGFFFKPDELATSLSAIEGATQGRVTFVGQSGTYQVVSNVTGVDRVHGIVTLKVARAKAPALTVGDQKQTTMGDRVGIVGSGAKAEPAFAPGAISGYLDDDRMEIGAQAAPTIMGGPLLNAQGEVVGIITDSPGNRAIAVPVNYLADLIKRKSQPVTLALAGAKDVLYDWRKSDEFKPADVDKDLEKRILEAVSRAHHAKPQTPAPSPSPQESPQTGGNQNQNPPAFPWFTDEMSNASITGVVNGSFTEAGKQQTAYLIDTRTGSHADNFGPKYLAIFNGETYVADFPVPGLSLILQTYDLNHDGINELLLGSSSTQMGEVMEGSKLLQIAQGKLRVLRDFGTTYHSTCGSQAIKDKGIDSSVIFYTPATNNQTPDFRVDNYHAACPPEGSEVSQEQWKYTSTGKLPDKANSP